MFKKSALSLFMAMNLTACGTMWENTRPKTTGLEQILISTAADRASNKFAESEAGKKVLSSQLGKSYIDDTGFENFDSRYVYALHSVRRYMMDAGVTLVDKMEDADTIIEVAAGALSIDNTGFLLGIPAMGVPIPLAGQLEMPEIALYKSDKNRSIAKFSVSVRDAKTGVPKGHSFTTIGTAWSKDWTILVLFEFSSNDLEMPEEYKSIGD